jgi:dimethylhistidine N-methyltransferase
LKQVPPPGYNPAMNSGNLSPGGPAGLDSRALVILLIGAAAISLAPNFVRLSEVGPSATAFYRLFFALPALFLWIRLEPVAGAWERPSSLRDFLGLGLAGLFFAADMVFWHWSITFTSVANATLLANSAPIFVTLGGFLLFGERFSRRFLLGLACAISGAAMLLGDSFGLGPRQLLGDAFGIIAAIFYAAYLMAVARLRVRFSTATVMGWSGLVTAIVLIPVTTISGESFVAASAFGWAVLVALALISQVGGQSMIAYALAHLTPAFGAVGLLLQPVLAALIAWALFAEALGRLQWAGAAVILAGVVLARQGSQVGTRGGARADGLDRARAVSQFWGANSRRGGLRSASTGGEPMSPDAQAPDPDMKFIKRLLDFEPVAEDFAAAVIAGLSASPKTIPPKFFYDARGSDIFNRICATEEYYITRTEIVLLNNIGAEIAAHAGPGVSVIEYGCGSSDKIRSLLDALGNPAEYWAIDISRDHLLRSADAIGRDYPSLGVNAVCADFAGRLELPGDMEGRRLAFFPGSTIGNQTPIEAEAFLARVRAVVGGDGALLIGVDLTKDLERLTRAYNDAAGHTADFNLNLLHRMRAELGAELDPDGFAHRAFFNAGESCIEMHLAADGAQTIRLGTQDFAFADGETIHTENSYKYDIAGFQALAARAGFKAVQSWSDAEHLFSIHFLAAAPV